MARLWRALFAGQIVPLATVTEIVRPQHPVAPNSHGYGLGFWLTNDGEAVFLEGSDPGISFRSTFKPSTGLFYSVLSNTTSGAWPVVKELEAPLPELSSGR
jgi:hypothetical protein